MVFYSMNSCQYVFLLLYLCFITVSDETITKLSESDYCGLNCIDYFDNDQIQYAEETAQCRCPKDEDNKPHCESYNSECEDEYGINMVKRPFTYTEKSIIVHNINMFRNDVAAGVQQIKDNFYFPVATNMLKVNWDPELETIAEWVSTFCETNLCVRAMKTPRTRHYSNFGLFGPYTILNITNDLIKNVIEHFESHSKNVINDQNIERVNIFITNENVIYQTIIYENFEKIGCYGNEFYKFETLYLKIDCVIGPGPNNLNYMINSKRLLYAVGESDVLSFRNNNSKSATNCPKGYTRDAIYHCLCSNKRSVIELSSHKHELPKIENPPLSKITRTLDQSYIWNTVITNSISTVTKFTNRNNDREINNYDHHNYDTDAKNIRPTKRFRRINYTRLFLNALDPFALRQALLDMFNIGFHGMGLALTAFYKMTGWVLGQGRINKTEFIHHYIKNTVIYPNTTLGHKIHAIFPSLTAEYSQERTMRIPVVTANGTIIIETYSHILKNSDVMTDWPVGTLNTLIYPTSYTAFPTGLIDTVFIVKLLKNVSDIPNIVTPVENLIIESTPILETLNSTVHKLSRSAVAKATTTNTSFTRTDRLITVTSTASIQTIIVTGPISVTLPPMEMPKSSIKSLIDTVVGTTSHTYTVDSLITDFFAYKPKIPLQTVILAISNKSKPTNELLGTIQKLPMYTQVFTPIRILTMDEPKNVTLSKLILNNTVTAVPLSILKLKQKSINLFLTMVAEPVSSLPQTTDQVYSIRLTTQSLSYTPIIKPVPVKADLITETSTNYDQNTQYISRRQYNQNVSLQSKTEQTFSLSQTMQKTPIINPPQLVPMHTVLNRATASRKLDATLSKFSRVNRKDTSNLSRNGTSRQSTANRSTKTNVTTTQHIANSLVVVNKQQYSATHPFNLRNQQTMQKTPIVNPPFLFVSTTPVENSCDRRSNEITSTNIFSIIITTFPADTTIPSCSSRLLFPFITNTRSSSFIWPNEFKKPLLNSPLWHATSSSSAVKPFPLLNHPAWHVSRSHLSTIPSLVQPAWQITSSSLSNIPSLVKRAWYIKSPSLSAISSLASRPWNVMSSLFPSLVQPGRHVMSSSSLIPSNNSQIVSSRRFPSTKLAMDTWAVISTFLPSLQWQIISSLSKIRSLISAETAHVLWSPPFKSVDSNISMSTSTSTSSMSTSSSTDTISMLTDRQLLSYLSSIQHVWTRSLNMTTLRIYTSILSNKSFLLSSTVNQIRNVSILPSSILPSIPIIATTTIKRKWALVNTPPDVRIHDHITYRPRRPEVFTTPIDPLEHVSIIYCDDFSEPLTYDDYPQDSERSKSGNKKYMKKCIQLLNIIIIIINHCL